MKILSAKNLKGDLFGGLTSGIVALPLALAFGIQAFGVISVDEVVNIGAYGALAGLAGAMMLGFLPLYLVVLILRSAVPPVP